MYELGAQTASIVSKLEPRLRRMLDAELAAGNTVAAASEWPFGAVEVMVNLDGPFAAQHEPLPAGVTYLDVDDVHYWKAEYQVDVPTPAGREASVGAGRPCHHVLTCGFRRRTSRP